MRGMLHEMDFMPRHVLHIQFLLVLARLCVRRVTMQATRAYNIDPNRSTQEWIHVSPFFSPHLALMAFFAICFNVASPYFFPAEVQEKVYKTLRHQNHAGITAESLPRSISSIEGASAKMATGLIGINGFSRTPSLQRRKREEATVDLYARVDRSKKKRSLGK